MYKDGVITISDWQKGMAKSPLYGFELLKNVEVFEQKGIAKLKNRAVDSGMTVEGLPSAEVYDVYGNTYTFAGETGASQGTVRKNGSSIQGSLSLPWDLKIYKNYLWVSYSSVVSCYGPLDSGGAQWFGNVLTGFSSTSSGALLVGQDDFLYRANGNAVSKLEVTASGTVGVAPTIIVNTTLDLPDGQYATCLEEFGTKVVVGTCGSTSYGARNGLPVARLYAWNRQAGTLGNPGLADLPIIFNGENGVNAIKQHANKLYVSVGTQGNIYVSDATNYQRIQTIPYSYSGVFYSSTVLLNAMAITSQGTLLVGVSGDEGDLTDPGIYEIDLNTEGYPLCLRTPSSITSGNTSKIGFINQKDYQTLRFGWSNSASYGVDTTDFRMYDSFGGVIETPIVKVGDYNTKKTFQHAEFNLAEPLVTGQDIRISYRRNVREAYTLLTTWSYSNLGSVISFQDDTISIADCEYLQLKIELDQPTNTVYGYNLNLINLKLW